MDAKKLQKINGIITKNGNSLHYRIVKLLRSKGWKVEVSPYYNDNFSEKPREIDIIAENIFPVYEGFGQFKGTVNVCLFIECKYITQDTVFWFDERDKNAAVDLVLRTTPLGDPRQWSQTSNHHYLSNEKVAKLFASEQNRTSQSSDGEVMYKAVTQSLNALISYKHQPSILPTSHNNIRTDLNLATIDYPIIVCDSFNNFYSHDVAREEDPKEITENFQMEIRYAYRDNKQNSRNEYFLVDVTTEDKIEGLLTSIENLDVAIIRDKLHYDEQFQ